MEKIFWEKGENFLHKLLVIAFNNKSNIQTYYMLYLYFNTSLHSYFRVTVELARGTPHGRDRERWGDGRGGGRYDRGGGDRRDR